MSYTTNLYLQNTNSLNNTKIKISNSTLNSINKSQTNSQKDSRPITCKINSNKNMKSTKILKGALQSARIYPNQPQPKLFSLVDIKDRYYSKGTSHPNQFKRKIYININKFLYSKDSLNLLKSEKFITNNDLKTTNETNAKILKKIRKNFSQSALPSFNKNPKNIDLNNKKENNKEIKRDIYKPLGYETYEKAVNEFNKNYIKNNYLISLKNIRKSELKNNYNSNIFNNAKTERPNEAILIRKQNKLNSYKSDIFFTKENNKTDQEKRHTLCKNQSCKFKESDIFNLKNVDENIIQKSGEKSYFRELKYGKNVKNLDMNKESKAKAWGMRDSLPSFLNHESTKYNLLNCDIKNNSKTKEQIISDGKKISNDFNPVGKKKSLCEFIDLSRVSAPNINEDFNKAFTQNPNMFKKQNAFNSEYFDIYNQYKNLCDKPFQKFNPIY